MGNLQLKQTEDGWELSYLRRRGRSKVVPVKTVRLASLDPAVVHAAAQEVKAQITLPADPGGS